MKPKDFKRWRKLLGLSQKAAAEALGLKRRVVQYYEKGERDGKDVGIPKAVRLACYAISEGVSDYHGPRDAAERPPANGAAHDARPNGAPAAILSARAAEGKAEGKKKREKERDRDKAREKSKGKGRDKSRGKGEPIALAEKH
jgi:transcriptional regulator with XRE-family HTH domain